MTSETITRPIVHPAGDITDLAASWLRELSARTMHGLYPGVQGRRDTSTPALPAAAPTPPSQIDAATVTAMVMLQKDIADAVARELRRHRDDA